MCKLGDIIVIKEFRNEFDEKVRKHSFVVINDEKNCIEGLHYDFISNMLCSFHDDEHKSKKMSYRENLLIKEKTISGDKINEKEGFIKADQLYYFDKNEIEYKVIARLDDESLTELVQLILALNEENKLKIITTNLKEKITV